MLMPTDIRILNARPDHLQPMTEHERAAADLIRKKRDDRSRGFWDLFFQTVQRFKLARV